MIVNAASPEHCPSHYDTECNRNDEPSTREQVQIVGPWIKEPEEEDSTISNKCDRHQAERDRVARNDQCPSDNHEQPCNRKRLEHEKARRLERSEDKNHERQHNG